MPLYVMSEHTEYDTIVTSNNKNRYQFIGARVYYIWQRHITIVSLELMAKFKGEWLVTWLGI